MTCQVPKSNRLLDVPQVPEEPNCLGPIPNQLLLFITDAGSKECSHTFVVIEDQKRAVSRVGQRACAINNRVQSSVYIQAGGDANTGITQLGESISQPLILVFGISGIQQSNTRYLKTRQGLYLP